MKSGVPVLRSRHWRHTMRKPNGSVHCSLQHEPERTHHERQPVGCTPLNP